MYNHKLADPQPPLPPGTAIVSMEYYGDLWWYPVCSVDGALWRFTYFTYFLDPHGRSHLYYKGEKGRRQAIGYLWRRYRRGDLEYSRGRYLLQGGQCHLDYCSTGVVGNLYQRQNVTVAEASERLSVPKAWILKLIREGKLKAAHHSGRGKGKEKWKFHNYYTFSLAHLEAYIDQHGYGKDLPSMAEKQRQLAPRRLPITIWCV